MRKLLVNLIRKGDENGYLKIDNVIFVNNKLISSLAWSQIGIRPWSSWSSVVFDGPLPPSGGFLPKVFKGRTGLLAKQQL